MLILGLVAFDFEVGVLVLILWFDFGVLVCWCADVLMPINSTQCHCCLYYYLLLVVAVAHYCYYHYH